MAGRATAFAALAVALCAASVYAQTVDPCASLPDRSEELYIKLNASTVAWGYFWKYRPPVAYIKSGESFTIEMGSHLAGDYYEGMIKGDEAMEEIFRLDNFTAAGMPVPQRGRSGRTDGGHLMTGPVYVCGAEPGDTIKVEILDMKPRINPNTGKAYSSNGMAPWGWQRRFNPNFTDGTFIYELILDKQGYAMWAEPYMYFKWSDDNGNPLVRVPCPPTSGVTFGIDGKNFTWSNPFYTFGGRNFTCEADGTMLFGGYRYAGAKVQHPIGTESFELQGKYRLPVSPHIGNLGLASDVETTTNSAWPMRTGGNLDQKRLGVGSSLYLPVEVKGGLLSAGDCHAGQTASEFSGTALETSFNGRLKVTLIKANAKVKPIYKNLATPFMENKNEWCWHGFTVNDYLHDPQTANGTLGSWNTILPTLTTNTYQLMNNTAFVAHTGLQQLGFTYDEAVSILTFACDWEVTQVVNTNMGNNICCSKYIMNKGKKQPYAPLTFPGSSRPLKIKANRYFETYK